MSTAPAPAPNIRRRGAFDLETRRVGPGAILPRPVCASLAWWDAAGNAPVPRAALVSDGDPHWGAALESVLDAALLDGVEIVGHNVAQFDLPVVAFHHPHLLSKCFEVVARGLVRDTMFREQLLNLALKGYVDEYFLPDQTKKLVRYRLTDLTVKHLGRSREQKAADVEKGAEGEDANEERQDVWQLHFETLEGVPSARYPVEARDYVLQDAQDPLLVAAAQDEVAQKEFVQRGVRLPDGKVFDVFGTEWLHVRAGFALAFFTATPFGVDRAQVEIMRAQVEEALRPENVTPLFEAGILDRAEPAVSAGGPLTQIDPRTGETVVVLKKNGTPRMQRGRKAKKQKKNLKRLLEIVLATHAKHSLCDEEGCPQIGKACNDHGLPPLQRTQPSKKFPKTEANPEGGQWSLNADQIDSLAPFNPLLALYALWQSLGKIRDVELPLLEGNDHIHGGYLIIKKTGRTSCRGSDNYPSRNLQQLPRSLEVELLDALGAKMFDERGKQRKVRIEPRRCYKAPWEGWVLLSVDYAFLELCTLAQTVFNEIGHSKLREIIASGRDPHSWLAGQIAAGSEPGFAAYCQAIQALDRDARHLAFEGIKHGSEDEKAFFKKYRGLSKIVGLAFGGGMGAKKFVEHARKQYGVIIGSIDEAKTHRNSWLDAFPENREFLNKVPRRWVDEEMSSDDWQRYYYFSPLGMLRRRTSYTEFCNGFGLQTRAAEGAKLAIFDLARACWDPAAKNEILHGCRPVAFVHDEAIVAVPEDAYIHERATEVSRILCTSMKVVCPDVVIRAEPAAMRRWEKGADPVYGPDERLRIWEPGAKYTVDECGRLRSAT